MGIENARETIEACRYCFMCRFACPTFLATKRESVTPRGYALQLMMIDQGKQEWTEDIQSVFYQCSQCGLCREHCEYDWPEDEMVHHAREEMVKTGAVPHTVLEAADFFRGNNTMWPKGFSLPMDKPNPDVLYLAGKQTRAHTPEIIEATAQVFNRIGIEWSVLSEESECGDGLFDLGYADEAREQAKILADQIAGINPHLVVTSSAHCIHTLRVNFSQWEVDLPEGIQLLHTSEYLYQLLSEGKLQLNEGETLDGVGYHDPCMLGRKLAVYDPPRLLIEATTGRAPLELFHNKRLAECCGAGATTHMVAPVVANKVARKRLESVAETGASQLVTACPNCKILFREASDGDELQILDLIEFIAQRMV